MNRTDRLYALVKELRAASPRARSARWLAAHFDVSERTIERDIDALVRAGFKVRLDPDGYGLRPRGGLPPVELTEAEATALAVGLRSLGGSVIERDALSAMEKLVSLMPPSAAEEALKIAEALAKTQFPVSVHEAARSQPVPEPELPAPPEPPVPDSGATQVIERAIGLRRVLHLDYQDRSGTPTRRVVEPHGFVGYGDRWYLVAWCRLREEVRGFRLDRIQRVMATDEPVPERSLSAEEYEIPAHLLTMLAGSGSGQRRPQRRAPRPHAQPPEPEAPEEDDTPVVARRPRLVTVTDPPR
ncbi:MAG: helix-turn-helix transcriptional regulator [Micromonosporaceae bacterium]